MKTYLLSFVQRIGYGFGFGLGMSISWEIFNYKTQKSMNNVNLIKRN